MVLLNCMAINRNIGHYLLTAAVFENSTDNISSQNNNNYYIIIGYLIISIDFGLGMERHRT